MGRRKIEIKPIRDDRNRSVTFLKRKGGLFKKAHELSVLCSVDVAVIIFGHNKKLYEYSSSDIGDILHRYSYSGGPHEHKGPLDFVDRRGGDDEDDDDEGGDDHMDDRGTPQGDHAVMHRAHLHPHPGFQHVRHVTPSASPPIHNGTFPRAPSPLPPGVMSRPASRTSQHPTGPPPMHARRPSAHLGPQPPGYAYTPNPPFYNPQNQTQAAAVAAATAAASQIPRQPLAPHPASYAPPYPSVNHVQLQPAYTQDDRRASMPPAFPPQMTVGPPPQASMHRNPSHDHLQIPGQSQTTPVPAQSEPPLDQQSGDMPSNASSQPPAQQPEFTSPPIPQPKPLSMQAKSHSIFTPIDDTRSLLAQHWGSTSSNMDHSRTDPAVKTEPGGARSHSVDVAAMHRNNKDHRQVNGSPSLSHSRLTNGHTPPRANSNGNNHTNPPPRFSISASSDAKRPRLKVQIPSEQSGDEGGGPDSGPDDDSSKNPLPAANPPNGPSRPSSTQPPTLAHGVVLPPPSPSAGGTLLSAGAQGPPNPFARPAPPMSTNPHATNRDAATTNNTTSNTAPSNANVNNIETPISALPSRFMSDNLLPSPSTFYPEWGFGNRSADVNMLPSPLNFQTPVVTNGGGWREEEKERDRKRPAEDAGGEGERNGGGVAGAVGAGEGREGKRTRI